MIERAAGEPRLQQEIAQLIEQILQVDGIQQLGEILGVRGIAHTLLKQSQVIIVPAMSEGPEPLPSHRRPGLPSAFGALRHRNFRLFYGGQLVSLAGTWMGATAQAWLVLVLTDSPFYVGLVGALGSLPVLLLALFAGTVADRMSKLRLVMITQASAMALAFLMAALVLSERITVTQIIVIATLLLTTTTKKSEHLER